MNLKQMREHAGLKQSELAAVSGVNLRSLQDYEQGHKSLLSAKGETLMRLGLALGYSIEDILSGSSYEGFPSTDSLIHNQSQRIEAYQKCLQARREAVVHFPIIIPDSTVDMSRIYPTKQESVKRVLSAMRSDNRVSSLRLFGSSITMSCHKDSDVDFAVGITDFSDSVRNEISERIQTACDFGADIIWLDHLNQTDRVYHDIMKGLVLI